MKNEDNIKITLTLLSNLNCAYKFGVDRAPKTWHSQKERNEMEKAVEDGLVEIIKAGGKYGCYKTTQKGLKILKQYK